MEEKKKAAEVKKQAAEAKKKAKKQPGKRMASDAPASACVGDKKEQEMGDEMVRSSGAGRSSGRPRCAGPPPRHAILLGKGDR